MSITSEVDLPHNAVEIDIDSNARVDDELGRWNFFEGSEMVEWDRHRLEYFWPGGDVTTLIDIP